MADLAGYDGQRKIFRVVGKPNLPGKLSYALATGVAKYGIDYVIPNMLYAKFLRSPYANAIIKSVDTTKAMKVPGVVDIVTWEDEDMKKLKGSGGFMAPPLPFLDNRAEAELVEVGLIVIAEDEDICDEAMRQLDIKWEVLPHVVDIREGMKPDAPVIFPASASFRGQGRGYGRRRRNNNNPPKRGNVSYKNVNQGNIEDGFKEADHIIEYDINLPPFASVIPNPPGSVAWWFDDPYKVPGVSLHIEGAVQRRRQVGAMYGMKPEKVVQRGLFQGGKYCDWGMRKAQEITPLLAKRTSRPVRMVDNRAETFDFLMNQRFMHLKVGFKKNGLITAIEDFSIADGGTRGNSEFGTYGDQSYGPYFTTRCLNIKQSMDIVDSNRGKMYVSGQHCPFNWDAMTMGIYIIADKLGKDPIDIATLNLHGPTSQKDTNPVPSYEACIKAGKKMMNWKWHKTGARKLPDGRLHGASFRYQMCPRHAFSGYNSKLEYRDGVVHLPTKGPCTGIYAVEANAMVVAEELGLEYKDVSIDFDYKEPFTPVGGGSDGTTASSWVTKQCVHILKNKILDAAVEQANNPPPPMGFGFFGRKPPPNPFKGLKPEDLDMQGGKIVIKSNPSKGLPLGEAVRGVDIIATYTGRPPASLWSIGMGRKFDTMNTLYCEVAVDTETGEVEILRFGAAVDPGKVMRRTSLESQIDQVLYFSQGCQQFTDYFFDKKTGVKLNNNMIEYKNPTHLDVPHVDKHILETRAGNAAYGSNGISHSMANTHLVICAIHNAIGKWIDPPASPDKVLKALGKA